MRILITGAAGFIGSNLVRRLIEEGAATEIVGVDNLNDYYDVRLKEHRLQENAACAATAPMVGYQFVRGDISDKQLVEALFDEHHFTHVVNLAAQAGVRYSIDHPDLYIQSNVIGFYNILEACRHHRVEHLVYASSSSVYGGRKTVPFSETDIVDRPISLYAATKKSDELFAYTYSHLYGIPSTGLRFFTVYGPAGRPDMAYYSFTERLLRGEKIQIFNYGDCERDFTYIDDIVEGIMRVLHKVPEPDGEGVRYKIYNLGNSHPERLLDFVQTLQEELVRVGLLPEDYDFEGHQELVAMQPGDVPITYADTAAIEQELGFRPNTSLRDGLRRFAEWYRQYHSL